ncbi:MAG: BatD family protein [Muribaculaceae bacterium]|nr:BatD family protein [Muribaculaceae bacterium]
MKFINKTILLFGLLTAAISASAKTTGPEISIEATIEKSAYVGEVLEYTVTLLSTEANIANVKIVKNNTFPREAKVINGATRNGRPQTVQKGGKTYYSWTIQKDYLIFDNPGKYTIDKAEYAVYIPHTKAVRDNFWGMRQYVEYEEVAATGNAVSFKVEQLPKKGEGSCDGVGDFTVEGWFPPGAINVGSEAYCIFKISGEGYLSDLNISEIYKCFKENCQLKEVEPEEEFKQRNGMLWSEVTLVCKFIPQKADFKIEPFCLKFFSPDKKSYYDACSDTLEGSQQKKPERKTRDNNAVSI